MPLPTHRAPTFDELRDRVAELERALTEECEIVERSGSRTYLEMKAPAKLERLDTWNEILGRPRHERIK
ncbi:MAG TPA: hypothetical protein VHN11_20975 [Xanthobacteraceae bacterium]|jgi:hypothetical protein|nr:hypothetical protein [Xanthobacteraceae bacterium]